MVWSQPHVSPGLISRTSVCATDGLEALGGLGGGGQFLAHLAELLALGLAPPDGPGDADDAEHADEVEPDRPCSDQSRIGTIASRATMFMTLISGFRAGPAVSLSGSPTVSPVTAALCASEPLPP